MPIYSYKCKECEHQFETRHGITEKLYDCENCDNEQTLMRIPQITNFEKKEINSNNKEGSLVKEFIEENKKILQEEKKQRIVYDD